MRGATTGLISDFPTVTVNTRKHFKALIDSGAMISLMCTSVYNMIEDHYKTCILPAALYLWTADRSPMSSMGKPTLHLWKADFNFIHTFVICDKVPDADFLYDIDLQNGILYHIVQILTDIFGKALFLHIPEIRRTYII